MEESNRNEVEPLTKISGKEYSPLVIRRYSTKFGILFVSSICDEDMNNLDNIVMDFVNSVKSVTTIQGARNFTGKLTEIVRESYKKSEGVAVIGYFDKLMISSLWGDFMSHTACRIELYGLLNMMTNV